MFDDLNHINVTNMRKKEILYASAFSKIEPLLVHLKLLHGIIRVLSYTLCGKSTLKSKYKLDLNQLLVGSRWSVECLQSIKMNKLNASVTLFSFAVHLLWI